MRPGIRPQRATLKSDQSPQKDHQRDAHADADDAADLHAFAGLDPLQPLLFLQQIDGRLGALAGGLGDPPEGLRLVKGLALLLPCTEPDGEDDKRKHRHDSHDWNEYCD